jgi:death-on-curing protein
LATDPQVSYIDYPEAVRLHFELMGLWGETRYGVDFRELLESALARPKNSAVYEKADIIRQAATLCFGLIKNHPWTAGDKRTACFLMDEFLFRNGFELTAASKDLLEMSLTVESGKWKVDEIKEWLRSRVKVRS